MVQINTLRRMQLPIDSATGKHAGYAVVYGTSSGSLGYIAPASTEVHKLLYKLQRVLYCGLPHTAGLHPKAFRITGLHGQQGLGSKRTYGKATPTSDVLDGQLLWAFAMASRQQQSQLAEQASCKLADLLSALTAHATSTTFY